MALDEEARNRMFTYFSGTELGVEVTSKMMSYFPARDVEEPVSKEHLRSELVLVRLELHEEMARLRADLRNEIAAQGADLRGEIGALRLELRSDLRQQFFWLLSTMLVVLGVLATLIVALH